VGDPGTERAEVWENGTDRIVAEVFPHLGVGDYKQ
jgi:hypothetical protein